ncbi:methyl-accepting chemotaxis protein [Alteromonas gilva]|uniref:Methyl-accepting chemotaxis protein n=1 Tax=Alteromonas gilva TaxID=2987522 RepID=A0ABT5L1U0_9ALTE|nr:methyl-accepting chemotaxis protein [Alteromonas gilva]MDC8831000.1 methyl-accepting chemotaxis protein [Alteromonas gilva]
MVQRFASLTIRSRLALGFGIILALLILLTIQGINKVNFIDRTLSEITDINSVKQRFAINFRGSVHDRAIAIRDIAIARKPSEITTFVNEIRELETFYRTSENEMNAMLNDDTVFSAEEKNILRRIASIQSRTLPLIEEIINAKRNNESVDDVVLDEARPAFIAWLNTINEFIDYQEQQNQQATPEAREVAGGFQSLMLVLTLISLTISVIVAFLIERSLRLSLGGEPFDAQRAIQTMANGDLTKNLTSSYKGSILDSLSDMSDKLTEIVRNIVSTSNDVSTQISEVAEGSANALDAAQKQAMLTNETASKLIAMRSSIDEVAEIAKRTEENSGLTVDYAGQGRVVVESTSAEIEKISTTVNQSVEQIKLLEENTKKIGGIAGVISGISEQTNLLALNAAIEAARAGESGRGFAVVADEVRQLAQRTGEATSQIESMISEVQAQTAASVNAMETTQPLVENGRAQVIKATELLENIERQANDSLIRVQEVARAASEQVNVVGDVSQAMEKITAMSEEATQSMHSNKTATQTLNELSHQLKEEVRFFTV